MLTNQHLLQAFEAAGAAGGVAYVSVPITSGLREIALLNELGLTSGQLRQRFRDRWTDEVVKPNEVEALGYSERVRAANPGLLVIDPSRLTVKGWEQDDYNGFWVELMKRHARKVVAVPGWEFSRGARGEVALGVALDRPVTDLDGVSFSPEALAVIDDNAREKLAADGWSPEQIDGYLLALDFEEAPALEPSAASLAFDWLVGERAYQARKFGTEQDDEHTLEGLDENGWWWRQLTSYFHRSRVLTLETLVGRQALAKFVATGCGLLESAIRLHGPLPAPGVPSGEVRDQAPDLP